MTIRKTIILTDKQDEWIKARIASGDYTNDSEYFRDLIRRDQERSGRFQALKSAVQEGLDSGVSDRTVGEIWAAAVERSKRGPFRPRSIQGVSLSDAVVEERR
ncbi:MAG: type II toxin-antitoxin system ParD family antitoxin [Acidobacteria bacterium]|nr:type II toxin-antitoxin system ParD family antitoxin [Acidobacteriota bacterium]